MLVGVLVILVGILDGIVFVYIELLGNFDGVVLVSIVDVIVVVDFELRGNLEDMVFIGINLGEGIELVVIELVSVVLK